MISSDGSSVPSGDAGSEPGVVPVPGSEGREFTLVRYIGSLEPEPWSVEGGDYGPVESPLYEVVRVVEQQSGTEGESGATPNVANIRRAVLDAEGEFRLALDKVGPEGAADHRDAILRKWLTNLGVLPPVRVSAEERAVLKQIADGLSDLNTGRRRNLGITRNLERIARAALGGRDAFVVPPESPERQPDDCEMLRKRVFDARQRAQETYRRIERGEGYSLLEFLADYELAMAGYNEAIAAADKAERERGLERGRTVAAVVEEQWEQVIAFLDEKGVRLTDRDGDPIYYGGHTLEGFVDDFIESHPRFKAARDDTGGQGG